MKKSKADLVSADMELNMVDNQKFKYTFYFFKKGFLIFISHLDLMRLLERAVKRSGIPAVYTEGFNPHLRLSLPFPLAVGYLGVQEVGEIYMQRIIKPEEIITNINKYLPADIQLSKAELSKKKDSLANHIHSFGYKIIFKNKVNKAELEQKFQAPEILLEKISKSGKISRINIQENILYKLISEDEFAFTLSVQEQRSINVDKMLEILGIQYENINEISREKINVL